MGVNPLTLPTALRIEANASVERPGETKHDDWRVMTPIGLGEFDCRLGIGSTHSVAIRSADGL